MGIDSTYDSTDKLSLDFWKQYKKKKEASLACFALASLADFPFKNWLQKNIYCISIVTGSVDVSNLSIVS